MNYWLDLFTGTTWNEYRKAGAKVSGFRAKMRNLTGNLSGKAPISSAALRTGH